MASNDYAFTTHWRVRSTCEEVSEVLGHAPDLVRWWPSVYLEIAEYEPGDAKGIGKHIALYTKGWLPYTLRWDFRVVESRSPHGFSLVAFGDFVGRGDWYFEQDGEFVNIRYDWVIEAEKPLLKNFSLVMKPIFSANHHWAMKKGEESLKLELDRRKGLAVPPPPGPTFRSFIKRNVLVAAKV